MENKFKFKSSLGQNFIKNQIIIERIIDSANILPNSLVIEVGPGSGALTKKLVEKSKYVLAYEIDKSLEPILLPLKTGHPNLQIIYEDFLKVNLKNDIASYDVENIYVIANLPYYITTPIVEKIINENIDVKRIVIMVQKEVGQRFASPPGGKEYNSLTVFLNYYFNIKKLFIVGNNNFIPQPKVDSIVISLEKKDKIKVNDINLFFNIVRDSFKHKRKTIKNNLGNYNLNIIEKVLLKYGFNLNTRAEQMPLEVFCDIANNLSI